MKTLFSRILFAQVVAVVLALLVVSGITRASLTRGFKDFLERQEATVLENVAPTLTGLYERRGDWDFLRANPAAWPRIWRTSVSPGGGPPETAGPRSGFVRGGRLKLVNLTKKIQDLLAITKLLTVFETYDSEEEAVGSF